ncbi:unnamed protein product (macronuclear) [Paramecium tetraurelia]|uniref:Uncharacterized protein n=1 Tax=Paramecium tetraurelia TaxID=5888 RepID=A0BZZ7_PARTE|nr:uncharacterized protein GSPATT00005966001 [Paramecium tetraurelia]CAK64114.1 unnamed protein product [Paramecium tetraurelia]|eukprot:XP_001431512.1 hypothetical protein (macronuclear) [Paramecium tetraurelia strain d4-2]
MKGLNYESKLTYTYSMSFEQMKRTLEIDGFDCFRLNDDLKIIEYSINNSIAIQLSLLLYLQEINLIRFTIAQQIQLCQHIYSKYLQLKQQNIQHNYLSSERIWLKILNNHQITILPKNLQYSIHFVGFDCPFYEKDNQQNSKTDDELTIKTIIIDILVQLKNKKLKKNKSDDKHIKLKQIFELLLNKGIYISFENFLCNVDDIFSTFRNTNQRLSDIVDKELTKFNSKRAWRVENVVENLKQIIQTHYKKGQCYQFQQILYYTFPKIAKELKTAKFYENQEAVKNINIYDIDQQLTIHDNYFDELINKNIESIMKDFKFEIDMQDIKETIKSELRNEFKILNYFLNQVKYQNKDFNQILAYFNNLKNDIIVKVVRKILIDELRLQILKLIDELI